MKLINLKLTVTKFIIEHNNSSAYNADFNSVVFNLTPYIPSCDLSEVAKTSNPILKSNGDSGQSCHIPCLIISCVFLSSIITLVTCS